MSRITQLSTGATLGPLVWYLCCGVVLGGADAPDTIVFYTYLLWVPLSLVPPGPLNSSKGVGARPLSKRASSQLSEKRKASASLTCAQGQ